MKAKTWIILAGIATVGLGYMTIKKGGQPAPKVESYTVKAGAIEAKVVETGSIEAERVVEVKSRVSGRVAKLLVDDGDVVKKGQLIAVIDPQETELKVQQDQAQLRGAQASVARTSIEMDQRRVTAQSNLSRAKSRLAQLEKEALAQPKLTRLTIESSRTSYQTTKSEYERLVNTTQPNERLETENAVKQAETSYEVTKRDFERESSLFQQGYSSKRDVDNAQLQLRQAEVNLSNSRDRLKRLSARQAQDRKNMEEKLVTSRTEMERAQTNSFQDDIKRREYDQALANLDDARAGLRDVEAMAASRAQGQASIDQIKSSLNDSLRQLGETEIRSPIDGVISKKLVQVGELVASLSSFSSGSPIVRIEDRSSMIVKLDINEIDVAKLTVGMGANITIDAFPGKTFTGAIKKIYPSSNALSAAGATDAAGNAGRQVVKYRVEIRINDNIEGIKSGMNASCTVVTDQKKEVILVPIDYVELKNNEAFVYKNKTKTKIRLGTQSAKDYEVLQGVSAGDKLSKPPYNGPERKGADFGGGGGG